MPNNIIITPKTFAVIVLASLGREVGCFVVQLPEQLLLQAQEKAMSATVRMGINMGIQYGAVAVGDAVARSNVDLAAPSKYFLHSLEALATASTPQEAANRGVVAAAVLILSGVSSADPNASLTFGGFLLVLTQNILSPGSQVILSKGLLGIFVIKNILIRGITEIRIERKWRELGLPRVKFKFNVFKKEEKKDYTFKYFRFKNRKIRILSRNIWLPALYRKELIIKQPAMVKYIPV